MAKPRKFAGLKGRIPEEQTPREAALEQCINEFTGKTIAELTDAYNTVRAEKAELAPKIAELKHREDALEILIRKHLKDTEAESIDVNGFLWVETCEPYPVVLAANVESVVEHMKANGYEDLFKLKTAWVTEQLKNVVKTQAEAGELEITEIDNEDGTKKIVVNSPIPGVQVFLKYKLSCRKGASK